MSEKLVLEAGATSFQDPEKGGWEPVGWDPLGENPCPEGSTGGNRVYTRNRRRVKKLIPVRLETSVVRLATSSCRLQPKT